MTTTQPADVRGLSEENREVAWLIEWPANRQMPVRYWHPTEGYVLDPNEATRFCRRVDAEAVIKRDHLFGGAKAAEHVWLAARASHPAPAVGGEVGELDLAALEKVARGATPGPWEAWSSIHEGMKAAVVSPGHEPLKTVAEVRTSYPDAVFLSTFDPPTVLRLLAELQRLAAEVEKWKAAELEAIKAMAKARQQARDVEGDAMLWKCFSADQPALLLKVWRQLKAAEARATKAEEERDAALRECSKWAREAGEAKGKLETSELAGIVEGWKERALAAEARLATVTRERDEAVGRVERWRAAAGPFLNWAADNVTPDPFDTMCGIWNGNRCERERIVDWFGPTDFRRLAALASTEEGEKGNG